MPLCRNIPNPLHATLFHLRVLVESFSHSFGDDGRAVGFQVCHHFLLFSNERIYLAHLVVKVRGDGLLFGERGHSPF